MNKLRSDSAFCQLTPEQTDVLEEWLFEERLGYPQVVEKLKAEFGLETSLTGVRRFYKRLDLERSAQSLMDAVEMSGLVVEALKSGTIKPGMLLLANKCAFELMRQSEPPIRKATALLRAITSAEANAMKQTVFEREENERQERERDRKWRESWRMTPAMLEREKEELRQERAARKKAKQEAVENAGKGKENCRVADAKSDGCVAPTPFHESKLGKEKCHLSPALSPRGGEGEESARRVVQGADARGSTLVNSVSEEGEGEKAAEDAGVAWRPSVVEDAENYTAEEAENRLTPLNAA